MTVTVRQGDLFRSDAQTLVNTVNTVGVMGKGIALEFKKRFPDMYEDYVRRCEAKQVKMGVPYVYRRLTPPWIINFPTKEHWRSVARLSDIVRGLEYLEAHYKEWGVTSLAVPPLGCGLGQLEWRVVGPTLYRHLSTLEIPVELFAPFEAAQQELQPTFLERAESAGDATLAPTRLSPGAVCLAAVVALVEKERYRPTVGRILFQKIAYFATQAGVPTGIRFVRGSYGPYSPDLKQQVITPLINNSVLSEVRVGRQGQMFVIRLGPSFPDARRAFEGLLVEWQRAIEKTADLVIRFASTRQAEAAAAAHFAGVVLAKERGRRPTEREVFDEVMRWKAKRRPPVDQSDVGVAIRSLAMLGWLNVQASEDLPIREEALLGA